MVLEEVYNINWLKSHPSAAFVLGVAYSLIGIVGALIIYPADPALLAVAITTLLFLPSMHHLAGITEAAERKASGISTLKILVDNKDIIKIYSFAFFGILLSFAFFSIALPSLAANVLFKGQLSVLQGGATFTTGLFFDIFMNNIKVLIFCFLISLIAGNGAMLAIAWNASVWGTIFGTLAKNSAALSGANPWIFFALIMLSVLPHTIIEMLSYVLSTISGTTISEGFIVGKLKSQKFMNLVMRNLILLLIAIGVLVIGGLVETYVLDNFTTYRTIIQIAFG